MNEQEESAQDRGGGKRAPPPHRPQSTMRRKVARGDKKRLASQGPRDKSQDSILRPMHDFAAKEAPPALHLAHPLLPEPGQK